MFFAVVVQQQQQQQQHPFYGPLFGATRVSWCHKGELQWHQLGHMQICTSSQTDTHTSTPPLSF